MFYYEYTTAIIIEYYFVTSRLHLFFDGHFAHLPLLLVFITLTDGHFSYRFAKLPPVPVFLILDFISISITIAFTISS